MAFTSKLPMNMLLGANGQPFSPQGGLNDSIWGQHNIQNARQNEGVDRIHEMGQPNAGFLNTSKYGLPNATWDNFNGLMMGLRDAATRRGQRFKMTGAPATPSILGKSGDTRFDGDQIGVNSGQSLTDDTYGDRENLKMPISVLRQHFGLK